MRIKEFLKNLWSNLKYDETGQWGGYGYGDLSAPAKYTPTKALSYYRGNIPSLYKAITKKPSYGGSVSPVYQYPKGYTPSEPRREEPRREEPRREEPRGGGVGGGYQPFDFSKYMAQYQPTGWTPPGLPQEPQVTQAMIAEWQKRSREEAGMQFDPQLLAIQQELEKMLLGAEQAKGGIEPAYQDIVDYIKEWQEEETGAAQRRYYARGLGRGGGLTGRETEIAEQALKETTAAGTEMARKLSDIESQKLLMMEQAGAKKEEIEVQRGRYTAARSADLEESYRQNKTQLEQQRFANQMQIAQTGMTKEAEDFNRWLGTMSAANEMWYREQTLTLERESMSLSSAARAEAAQFQKEQAGKLTPYQEANMFTLPSGQKMPMDLAVDLGYIPQGQYAGQNVPEESSWVTKAQEEAAKYQYMDLAYGISPYAYRRQADMPANR